MNQNWVYFGPFRPKIEPKSKNTVFQNSVGFLLKSRCSGHSDWIVQIPFSRKMVPNVVIQNYPDLSKEMKNGHKKHFLVKVILYETLFGSILGLKGAK